MRFTSAVRSARLWLSRILYESRQGMRAAPDQSGHALEAETLEERILLSAVPAAAAAPAPDAAPGPEATATDSADSSVDQQQHDGQLLEVLADAVLPEAENSQAEDQSTESSTEQTLELVFIDPSVNDMEQLLEDLRAQQGLDPAKTLEIIVLDADEDGIAQISEELQKHSGVDSVHIVSHGTAGEVTLGSTRLSLDNLDAWESQITSWQDALADQADLLFYGCNLAGSADGQELMNRISAASDTDVAASDDNTGHAALGGDWELEFQTGSIEANVVFSESLQQSWADLMNVTVDATSTSTVDGSSSDTISHTTSGSDRLMLVAISFGETNGDSVTSVTYNGSNLTFVGAADNADSSASRVEIWSLVAPVTGTHNVIVNFSGTSYQGATIGVVTFNGVDQASALGSFGFNEGDSSSASASISSADGETVFAAAAFTDSNDWNLSPSGSQTEYWDLFNNKANGSATLQSGSASVSPSWSIGTSGKWAVGGVSIKAAATTTETVADDFGNESGGSSGYSGNDGTQNWTNDWQELGESDGAFSGHVENDGTPFAIEIGGSNTSITGDGVWREVDLTGAGTATLTFDAWRSSSGGSVTVAVSGDGGSTWTDLQTYTIGTGTPTSATGQTFDISAYAASNTRIRFLGSGSTGDPSYFYADNVQIEYSLANSAPVLAGATNLTSISEDPVSNVGTLISALISGQITDANVGAMEGIAVVAVDDTNGTWQYTINDGANWADFGSVSNSSARLLHSAADTRVRFVPDADWNGTVSNGLTFHAWDQTSGINGGTADLSDQNITIADQFNSVSWSNNDGTDNWTSDWIEVWDDVDPSGGNVQVTGGALSIDDLDGNNMEAAYRSFDLTNATAASLTVDFGGYVESGTDSFAFEISDDGGATWVQMEEVSYVSSPGESMSGSRNFDLTSFVSLTGDMTLRFSITSGFQGSGQHVTFDNVQISATIPATGGTTAFSSASASSSITVTAVNDDPTISTIANQVINEDTSTGALAFSVGDVETATGSLIVTASSNNTTIIPNGNLNLVDLGSGNWTIEATPAANQNGGPVTITVTVDDGTTTTDETFTVTVNAVNDDPTISTIANQVINEDNSTGALAFSVGDVETATGSLIVTASSNNTTIIPNGNLNLVDLGSGNWTIEATPALNQNGGPVTITVTVDDGTTTTDETFTVTVNAVNDDPTISTIANQVINEDNSTGALAFSVGDVETATGSLIVTASSNNTTIIPNGNLNLVDLGSGNWTIEATPALNQNGGPVTITVTVDDGTTTTDETFNVTVNAVNDDPTITAISNQVINEDTSTGALAFSVGDVETATGSLIVTASSNNTTLIPNGNLNLVDLGSGNWTIEATPAANQNGGPVTITVTVDDGTTTTDETFTVTVNAVNDDPTISSIANQVINEDTSTGALAFSVGDAETATGSLIVTASSNDTTIIPNGNLNLVDLGSGNWTIEATPALNQNGGPVIITVTVDDGTTTTDETFTVTVNAVNDPPAASVPGAQITNQDTPLVFSTGNGNALSISDIDASTVEVELNGINGNISLSGTAGLSFTTGDGTNDSVMVFTGSVASINTALQGLSFNPDTGYNGAASLTLKVNDLGGSGSGGPYESTHAVGITVGSSTQTYQNGSGGYSGSEDTELREATPSTSYGSDTSISVDLDNSSAESQGLIQFQNLFGSGAGQIPVGSTIQSASLTLHVFDVSDSSTVLTLHRMTTSWSEADTWNSLSGGVTLGADAITTPDSTMTIGDAVGPQTFYGLEATVQQWADGGTNDGWAILSNSTDGWDFYTSEHGTVSLRPVLTISYTAPQAATIDLDADNSSTATGSDFLGAFVEDGGPVNIADADTTITDSDDTHLQSMTVTLTNLSDAGQEFLAANTSGTSIVANYNSGTGVLQLTGTDTLANYRQVLQSVTYDNLSNTPTLTTRVITILADDGFSTSNVATASITVTQSNDSPVVGTNTGMTVNEGSSAGTITTAMLNEADVDDDGTELTYTVTGNVSHGTLTLSGFGVLSVNDTFTQDDIDNNRVTYTHNGTETTADSFDFSLADGLEDGAVAAVGTFNITVTPVNDAPVLTVPGTQTITEDTQTPIAGISFTDSDDGGLAVEVQLTVLNGILSLDLSGGATVSAGANNSATMTLSGTKTQLNAALGTVEYLPGLNLTGTAADTLTIDVSDLGNTGLGGTQTDNAVIQIDVAAVNDEQSLTTNTGVTVNEGDTGTVITRLMLETTDVDNTAAQLQYTLTAVPGTGTLRLNGTALSLGQTFTQADIDAGLLTYDHNDAEVFADAFSFTVDDGTGDSTAGTFNILINSVNDNDPVIVSDGGGPTAGLNLAENVTIVTTVSANDADLPAQTPVYTITGGADAARFSINSGSGVLTFGAAPDYESPADADANNVYEVIVQVGDGFGRFDQQTITVTVTDVDEYDVTPITDTNPAADAIDENVAIGTAVGITAFSQDLDGTTNAITYTLDDDAGGLITIDSSTGVIRTAAAIDYETTGGNLTITVRATSADTSTITQNMSITVNDLNDNVPVVTTAQAFNVSEFAGNGTVIGTAAATDVDTVGTLQNWQITGGNSDGIFAIDAATGVIRVVDNTNLDYESQSAYALTVTTGDGVNTSAAEVVTINVTDLNDAPVIAPVAPFSVDENAAAGTVVGTVTATDQDAGDSEAWSITAGNTGGAFAINSATGQITVAVPGALDFETLNTFTLTVQVSDSGALTDSTAVTVNLNDLNEAPTDITMAGGSVAENSANGTSVATLSAVDADAGDTFTWTLTNSAGGRFAINTTTGAVTVADSSLLDFESNPSHLITAQVTDSGGQQFSRAFTINVSNVNEAPVAVDDAIDAQQGQTLTYDSASLLDNDSDVDGDPLTAVLVTGPTDGVLVLNADGTFDYTPDGTFYGADSFTYYATDGLLNSAVVTVQLDVLPAGSPPLILNISWDIVTQDDSADLTETTEPEPETVETDSDSESDSESESETTEPEMATERDAVDQAETPTEQVPELPQEVSGGIVRSTASEGTFQGLLPNEEVEAWWSSGPITTRSISETDDVQSRATRQTVFRSLGRSGETFTNAFLDFVPTHRVAASPEAMADLQSGNQMVIGSSVALTTSFSVGYVMWMMRGGSLLTTFVSSLPAWQAFDPLPIIDRFSRDSDGSSEDESLESLVS